MTRAPKQKKKMSSMRFCRVCERNTIFIYNNIIGHSECRECGFRFSAPVKEKVIELINTRIVELKRHLETNGSIEKRPVEARIDELCYLRKKLGGNK
jgi:ribosomal protein L37AE/L43A